MASPDFAEQYIPEREAIPVLATVPEIPCLEIKEAKPDLTLAAALAKIPAAKERKKEAGPSVLTLAAVLAEIPCSLNVVLESIAPKIAVSEKSESKPAISPVHELACPIETESTFPSKDLAPETFVPAISLSEKMGSRPVSDIALDLVLNELVLQARLTTNATGAVFALACSGELVCRGTTGSTASDVATFLNTKSGISATCFATGAARRVDDLGPDINPDSVAYRRSGVRSILVVAVQGEKGPILGILQIFSPRANAFCDRDLLTLQALARRIAANVELVQQHTVHQGNASEVGSKVLAAQERSPEAGTKASPGRRQPRPQVPIFVAHLGSKIASVDWIPILAKTSMGLILLAGTMLARTCWLRGANEQFAQSIKGSVSELKHSPTVSPIPVASNASPKVAPAAADPSAWPLRESSSVQATSSITIQRHPIRKTSSRENAAPEATPSHDGAMPENHKSALKSADRDLAASVLPNIKPSTEGGRSVIEVVPTQTAMARLIQRIEPEYPNTARQQHIQGTVLLDVVVNPDGTVDGLSMVSGESQLMAAAAQAVKQWRFQPIMKHGKAVKFETRIPIDFILALEGSGSN